VSLAGTRQPESAIMVSTVRSCASPNFSPLPENTLMPLSVYGLCDADSTTPRSKSSARVRNATPGVGITPVSVTVAP
jgi:hypothetical protein